MKKNRLFKTGFIITILLLYLVGCKNKENVIVTGEGNEILTQDFFDGLVEIEDAKQRIIKDIDKLQVICQALSELELTEIPSSKTISHPVKLGHSIYALSYSDGSKKWIFTLGTEIGVDKGNDSDAITYRGNQDVSDIFNEQFKEVE